ncbi:Fic family protein [uncultured Treponema sp.]|mgnify:FL=1|uniref:Fic family protein n=1 Tax=uncultured Treponema sp. TaxID=162155 RepID=UPI00258EE4FB|nr:Fic family protein [uncultured Treponema sp.]
MKNEIIAVLNEYNSLGINQQLDYDKFYLYSIITHSTAIEDSTITEIENQVLFDNGISCSKPVSEQFMNLDLKKAYEQSFDFARKHEKITVGFLCSLSGTLMKNIDSSYNTVAGSFSSAKGELRLLNVSAGRGGKSYLAWQKVPDRLQEFCGWLNEELEKTDSDDIENAYKLSFESHFKLASIHPWADGNGRMNRLLMNVVKYEKNLVPSIVKKERRAEYIKVISESQDAEDSASLIDFMFNHHIQNLKQQIEEYKRSL